MSPGIPCALFTAAVQALGCLSIPQAAGFPQLEDATHIGRVPGVGKGLQGSQHTPAGTTQGPAITVPGTGFQERVAVQEGPAASLETLGHPELPCSVGSSSGTTAWSC